MAFSYSPKQVTDGLVLCLDAANPKSYVSGSTIWNDLSRSGYNGTLTSGPTYNSSNAGSIVFDGTDDYIDGTNISTINGVHSISIWFMATGAPSTNDSTGGTLFVQSSDINHGIHVMHSWLNQCITYSTVVNAGLVTANNTVLNNTVNNIIGVYNGSTQSVYINGILITSRSYTTNPVIGGTPIYRIGKWGYSGFNRQFNGRIYNVNLYNRALSSTEVLRNYNTLKGRFGL